MRKNKLRKRLQSYWKLEIGNVILVPGLMIFLAWTSKYELGPLSYGSMVPMAGLLFIGGIYWRAKLLVLDGQPDAIRNVMPLISRAQIPLAVLSGIVVGAMIAAWMTGQGYRSGGDLWTATIAAALSALEYVNYYHRQLQHFDHPADFNRLLTGKGFRRAQMARDLEVWRQP